MDIQIVAPRISDIQCDALIVGAACKTAGKGEQALHLSPAARVVDKQLDGVLNALYADGEFQGNLGELVTVYTLGKMAARRVLVVGLGAPERLQTQSFRRASEIAARHAQASGAHRITLALEWNSAEIDALRGAKAQVEGALLGLYTFRRYQHSGHNGNGKGVSQIQLVAPIDIATDRAELEHAIQHARALAEATNFARDLVNEPANVLTPGELANRASVMAKQFGLECEILDKAQLEALGMGGLLGVTRGSAEPPQFIILRYRGNSASNKALALVGKGITFDSGGISIKPAERMDEMKGDMGGAAAVIGAMQAIAALRPQINVTALVPTCENMVSGTSYHPGDILRIMNGKTIEIVNTDAEGRLILADALSYAVREGLSPIIDLATLTGGINVALGHVRTGLFSNDEQLAQDIMAAGQAVGEKFWPMPLDEEYAEQIKSDIADIKQTGGRPASSVTAAKILEQFVDGTQWAHLDIAGTSYVDSKKPYQEKGATGVGVRTLAELILRRAQA